MLALFLTIENEEERQTAEEIWDRYRKHIMRIASSVLKNEADAEDAVMDTVCNIVRHISLFSGLSEKERLCLIVVYTKNSAFKIFNKKKRERERVSFLSEEAEDPEIKVEDFVMRREDYETASRVLGLLPELSVHIFLLRYYYHWPIRKIASFYEMSEAAVKKRLQRTKQKLKKQMEEER